MQKRKYLGLIMTRITEGEKYDGFYAVITNLEGDVNEILKINRQRWEIEENFRIYENRFQSKTSVCKTGRPDKGALSDLLYQSATLSIIREKTAK